MSVRYEAACLACDWRGSSNNREWFHHLILKHMDEHLDEGATAFGMNLSQSSRGTG